MILIVHRNPRIVSIHRVVCGSRVISQWPSKRRLVWRSIFLWSLTSPSAWVVTLVTPWTMRLAARLFRRVICVLPRYVLQPLLRVAWATHSEVLLNGVVCLHDRKVWPFFVLDFSPVRKSIIQDLSVHHILSWICHGDFTLWIALVYSFVCFHQALSEHFIFRKNNLCWHVKGLFTTDEPWRSQVVH